MGILTFSFKVIQIPHPWDKIIGQNVHPAASEGGKMSRLYDQNRQAGDVTYNQNPYPGDRPHDQTPVVSLTTPPPLPWGLTLIGA